MSDGYWEWIRAFREWCAQTHELTPGETLVIMWAVTYGNGGGGVRPGVEELCEVTGFKRSLVLCALSKAVAAGWLIRVQRGQKGQRAVFARSNQLLAARPSGSTGVDPDDVQGPPPWSSGSTGVDPYNRRQQRGVRAFGASTPPRDRLTLVASESATEPPLTRHAWVESGECCPLPRSNRVHYLS